MTPDRCRIHRLRPYALFRASCTPRPGLVWRRSTADRPSLPHFLRSTLSLISNRRPRVAWLGAGMRISSECRYLSCRAGSFAGRGESLIDCRPVHDVPPGLDVVSTPVLIVEVVRVLPHVEAKDRHVAV